MRFHLTTFDLKYVEITFRFYAAVFFPSRPCPRERPTLFSPSSKAKKTKRKPNPGYTSVCKYTFKLGISV